MSFLVKTCFSLSFAPKLCLNLFKLGLAFPPESIEMLNRHQSSLHSWHIHKAPY